MFLILCCIYDYSIVGVVYSNIIDPIMPNYPSNSRYVNMRNMYAKNTLATHEMNMKKF
jgi:amino acid permease